MEFTVVNGAGAIARGVTKLLAKGSPAIRILDFKVYRPSVYKLQEELKDVKISKTQVLDSQSLEYSLEGSENVIYFTHDYLSMSYDKNSLLEATAKSAKAVGVKKLICVCPIESDMYYTEEDKNPLDAKYEAENHARVSFPNMILLHPNLVFGDYSYLIRYMTQSVIAGKIHKNLADPSDTTKYYPIHFEDIVTAITHAIQNHDQVKGGNFALRGSEGVTLSEIKELIESHFGGKKTAFTNNFGIGNFIGEFFVGLSHDKNMCLMADYFKKNFWEFTHDHDYFKTHHIEPTHHITKFFKAEDLLENKFVHPLFSGYKSSELD